jgi:hypothetical protein
MEPGVASHCDPGFALGGFLGNSKPHPRRIGHVYEQLAPGPANQSGFIGPPDCDDEWRNIPEALVDFRKAARCCGQKDSEMPHVENDRIVESTNEARAGVTGQNVNYVLLISTVAVIVLFAVAYLVTSS